MIGLRIGLGKPLCRIISSDSPASNWILAAGSWSDSGVWDDSAVWID